MHRKGSNRRQARSLNTTPLPLPLPPRRCQTCQSQHQWQAHGIAARARLKTMPARQTAGSATAQEGMRLRLHPLQRHPPVVLHLYRQPSMQAQQQLRLLQLLLPGDLKHCRQGGKLRLTRWEERFTSTTTPGLQHGSRLLVPQEAQGPGQGRRRHRQWVQHLVSGDAKRARLTMKPLQQTVPFARHQSESLAGWSAGR